MMAFINRSKCHVTSKDYEYSRKLLHSIPVSKETLEKRSISMTGKNIGNTPWNKNKIGLYVCANKTRKKLSIKSLGKNNGMFNKKHTQEAKEKIGKANTGEKNGLRNLVKNNPDIIKGENNHASKPYKITTPNNEIIEIKGLRKYCEEHKLYHTNMIKVANGKQDNHKGYKCERL